MYAHLDMALLESALDAIKVSSVKLVAFIVDDW